MEKLIAALYVDEHSAKGEHALQVRIAIRDVAFLHELRDVVLRGFLEERLRTHPLQGVPVECRVDYTQFVEMYERSVLSLDKLTDHQKARLEELRLEEEYAELKKNILAWEGTSSVY